MPQDDDELNPLLNEKDMRKRSERQLILDALKNRPPGMDYVWDGVDEDDKPLTPQEMDAGLEAMRKLRQSGKES
ncbi:MAG: hypothetical protein H7346_06630 [Burkholderiaceae bacterium]|jgi:hypothetical protein|nr:hypothetical protein [Burkholderiaceae bacterium]